MAEKINQNIESEIIQLYENGMPIFKIHYKLNIGKNTVHRVLKRNNIERRSNGGRYKLSVEEKTELKSLYESGVHMSILREQFCCSASTARSAIKELGGNINRTGKQIHVFTKNDIDSIIGEYGDGKSQTEIVELYQVSQSTISALLRKNKIHIRKTVGKYGCSWKGGKSFTSTGYILILLSSSDQYYDMTNAKGYVLEHRLVMAQYLGRSLTKNETVHHINGDKTDNRLENLQLRIGKHGAGERYQCNCCGSHDIITVKI